MTLAREGARREQRRGALSCPPLALQYPCGGVGGPGLPQHLRLAQTGRQMAGPEWGGGGRGLLPSPQPSVTQKDSQRHQLIQSAACLDRERQAAKSPPAPSSEGQAGLSLVWTTWGGGFCPEAKDKDRSPSQPRFSSRVPLGLPRYSQGHQATCSQASRDLLPEAKQGRHHCALAGDGGGLPGTP